MAKDSDEGWRRKREREDEDEQSQAESKKNELAPITQHDQKVDGLIHQVNVLVEQLDRLYTMYFQGLEKLPPIQKRKLLEDLIEQLDLGSKPTAQLRFKTQSARTKFATYRERWEKKLKDLEMGRIKRN